MLIVSTFTTAISFAQVPTPLTYPQRFEKDGLVIQFSVSPLPNHKLLEGSDAIATFTLTNAGTGQPTTGLRPSAWLSARKTELPPSEAECKERIRTFLGGLISARAEVDLNSYLLLTLNHDKTVAFINPQVSFSVTKLERLVPLPGVGADWALGPTKEFLYVTLPEQSAVAVINTNGRPLAHTVPLGDRAKPGRIAIQPNGRHAWIALEDGAAVAVIDTATNKLVASVSTGAGPHSFAFTPDGKTAFVSNSIANTVSIIDTRTLKKINDVAVGRTPRPIAYSSMSRVVYVLSESDGTISVIDPSTRRVVTTISTKPGTSVLRFAPDGRFAFLLNPVDSTVSVLDSTTNKIIGAAEVVKSPDQIVFTKAYAYVRGTGSEKVSLIALSGLAAGRVAPVNVVAGRLAPSESPTDIGAADMIAPTPEGNSVMIANAPDQMVYYYVEGMMAPMGTFSNYKRRARAVMVLDRSLSEVAPGKYSTVIKLPRAGRYDVPVLIDQPRVVNCFSMEVAASPEGSQKSRVSIAVEALFKDKQFNVKQQAALRFSISDSETKQPLKGLDDVQVLVFEPPGIWQQRQWAKEVSPGVYEITQTFPHEGLFNVMVRVASRGVNYADLPFTSVKVSP